MLLPIKKNKIHEKKFFLKFHSALKKCYLVKLDYDVEAINQYFEKKFHNFLQFEVKLILASTLA